MYSRGVSIRRAIYSPVCGLKYTMMVAYVIVRLPGEFMAKDTKAVNLATLVIVVLLCVLDILEYLYGQKLINKKPTTPIIESDAQVVFDSLAFIAVLDWYLLSDVEGKNRNSLAYSMAFGSVFFFFLVLTARLIARSRLAAINTSHPYATETEHCKSPNSWHIWTATAAAIGVMTVFTTASYMIYMAEKEHGSKKPTWTVLSVVFTALSLICFTGVWRVQKKVARMRFSFAVLVVTNLLSLSVCAYEFIVHEGPQKKLWIAMTSLEVIVSTAVVVFTQPYFENSRIISTTALYQWVIAIDKLIVVCLNWPKETGTDFVTFSTFCSLIICSGSIMIFMYANVYMKRPKTSAKGGIVFDNNVDKERADLISSGAKKTESHYKLMLATGGAWLVLNTFVWLVALAQLRSNGKEWSFHSLVAIGIVALVVTIAGVVASVFLDLKRCYSDYFLAYQIMSLLTVIFETVVLLGGAKETNLIDYATLIMYNRELLIASGIPVVLIHARFHSMIRDADGEDGEELLSKVSR